MTRIIDVMQIRSGKQFDRGLVQKVADIITDEWQTTPVIIEKSKLSHNTVRNYLEFLKKAGKIERQWNFNGTALEWRLMQKKDCETCQKMMNQKRL